MKTVILAVLAFIFGVVAFSFYSQFNSPTPNLIQDTFKTKLSPTITKKIKLTPTKKNEQGKAEGRLAYPSEMIPELLVVAFNSQDNSEFYYEKTDLNQTSYEIQLPEGNYYLVSYVLDEEGSYGGGYTEAVGCGLSVECEDHSLIEVEVKDNTVLEDIDLTDWYAPENTFPDKPNLQ